MMLSEQEQIRREKLNKLKELGIDPFPAALFPINTNSFEINSNFEEDKKVSIAGRLMS
ncbi:MAG: lysine--tRNA ligase, partial [Flavobacteriaceae bacterium]|nr:lysine--tRNA ligase [Flavobacteriaceae bacterium]